MNGLRPASPREKEPGAPGSAAGWGRTLRPGAGSQLSARPSPKWRMRASLARLLPRAGHGTNARSFEDRESAAARLARWSRSALFTHPSLPRRGRERARYPPCSSSRDQSVSTTRSSVPRVERLLCAQGAGFQRLAPFPVGSWSLPRDQPEGQPSSRAAQESLKGCRLSLNKPLMCLANSFHVGRDEKYSIIHCHNNTSSVFPVVPPRDTGSSQQLNPKAYPALILYVVGWN